MNRPKKIKFSQTLYEAARTGSVQICDFLLNKGVTLEQEYIKQTIAEISAKGLTDIIKLLFTSFTDTMKNQLAEKLIITAIDSNKIDIALLFIELSKVNGKALIHAARNGLFTVVDEMLRKNSTPDFLNTNSRKGTALCEAASSNNIEIVKLLLSKPGIDVHIYNSSHDTALTIAAKKKNFEIIKLLAPFCTEKRHRWEMNAAFCIFYSTDMNYPSFTKHSIPTFDDFIHQQNNMNRTLFKNQISYDNFDITPALFFLEFEGIDINYTYQGTTILGEAIENGCLPLIELLLSRPEFETSIYTGFYSSIFSIASMTCDTQTITLLLNKIVEINNKYNDDYLQKNISSLFNEKEFYDIFVNACECGRVDLVKFFISDESPIKIIEKAIIESLTTMITSFNERTSDIVSLLLALDFDINAKIPPKNQSLLLMSALSGALGTFERIIAHPKFVPDKEDIRLALFSILPSNNITLISSLLNFLDDDVNQINQNGESLLIAAVTLTNLNNTIFILNHQSFNPIRSMAKKAFFLSINKAPNIAALFINSNFIDINEPYEEDFSLIHGSMNSIKDIITDLEYNNGGTLNINGWTPLMIAGASNDAFDLIMNAPNVDINKKGDNGSAPIFVALIFKLNMLDVLLNNPKLDVNIQNSKGWTPLIATALLCDFASAIKLLKNEYDTEIDINIKDNNGLTAINYFEIKKVFQNERRIPTNKQELIESLTKYATKEGIPG